MATESSTTLFRHTQINWFSIIPVRNSPLKRLLREDAFLEQSQKLGHVKRSSSDLEL